MPSAREVRPACRGCLQQPFECSSTDYVDSQKYHYPHGVDEVPIPREYVGALDVTFVHVAAHSQYQYEKNQQQADSHMQCVQADERVISRAEEIGANGQSVAVDEMAPFHRGADHELEAQREGYEPP